MPELSNHPFIKVAVAATLKVIIPSESELEAWVFRVLDSQVVGIALCIGRTIVPSFGNPGDGTGKDTAFMGQVPKSIIVSEQESHTGSLSRMSILQWGQEILSPMAWGGNSMCCLQKKHVIFRRSGLRRVIAIRQCGHVLFRPRF